MFKTLSLIWSYISNCLAFCVSNPAWLSRHRLTYSATRTERCSARCMLGASDSELLHYRPSGRSRTGSNNLIFSCRDDCVGQYSPTLTHFKAFISYYPTRWPQLRVYSSTHCSLLAWLLHPFLTHKVDKVPCRVYNRSLIHLFIYSFVHSLIHSSIHSLIRPFIHPFIHSFSRPFTHSYIFIPSFVHRIQQSNIS